MIANRSRAAALLLVMVSLAVATSGCVTEEPKPDVSLDQAALTNTQLGLEYMRQGDLRSAQEKIEKALDQDPRTAQVQMAAGFLYDRLGENAKAESHFEQALKYSKNDPDVLNNFAVFLCRKGDKQRGVEYFLQAAQSPLYTTPAAAYTNAGYCALDAGRVADAETYFRQAISYPRGASGALLPLARIYYEQGNNLQARAFLDRYLEVGPVDAGVLWLGYRIERAMGDTARAQEYATRLKDDYATSVETRDLLRAEQGGQ